MSENPGEAGIETLKGEGIYLFCFARLHQLPVQNIAGLDDRHPVYQWTFKDIAAVLSKVSLDEYCGPAAESRM